MGKLQCFLLQKVPHIAGAFALIEQYKAAVRIVVLRLGQHRHFGPARRAPTGPQIDQCELRPRCRRICQRHRRAIEGRKLQSGPLAGQWLADAIPADGAE